MQGLLIMNKAYLLLGGNVGDRIFYLASAKKQIENQCGHIVAASALYETEAWGLKEQDKFLNLLTGKKLKFTYERRHIFEEIEKLNDHFDADSLYDRLKKKGYRIARDTVYRTLPLLLECGIIQKSAGVGKRDYFE